MPDDDSRSTQIERSINRNVADALTMTPHGGSVFTVAPRSMGELLEFAKLMSVSGICIRPMFRGNPGACLALTLQAMKWGADPFAVANKAFEVNGQLSYESQLIHAIVNSSSSLAGRLNATYIGEGATRQCLVVGVIKGETEAREYQSPKMSEITPKNSPLWKTDPDQQLFYYSTRAWARRWVPEVLLGIYTPDEVGRTIEMVPAEEPRREDFVEAKPEAIKDDRPVYTVVDLDGVEHEFREEATAEAALTRVLEEAERQGPDRLAGARESNGLPPPEPAAKILNPKRAAAADPATKPPEAHGEAIDGAGSASEANARQSHPAAGGRSGARGEEDEQTRASAEGAGGSPAPQPWPLDNPREEVVPDRNQTPFAGDKTEAPVKAGAAPPPPNFPAVQQQERSATDGSGGPATAGDTNDDPDRGSLAIAPPIRRGRPDWRTWTIALFLPKVRQAKTVHDLAFLCGDNDDNLTRAKAELARDDKAMLEEAIAQRYREIGDD